MYSINKRMKIFVSIASYRDPLLSATIYSIFSKARWPGRVIVGVYNQTVLTTNTTALATDTTLAASNERIDWERMPKALRRTAKDNTHVIEVDYMTAGGPLCARQAIVSEFATQIQMCDIFFQIDSCN